MVPGYGVGQVAAALVLQRDAGLPGAEARAGRDRRHLRDTRSSSSWRVRKLLLFAGPSALAAPVLFSVICPEWEISDRYAQALAGYLGAQLVASPRSQTLVVF